MSVQADLKKHGGNGLWDLYLNESKYHIHRGDNMDLVIFSDALALQGERVIENVMKYLKCSRNRARDIVFKDTREKRESRKKGCFFIIYLFYVLTKNKKCCIL